MCPVLSLIESLGDSGVHKKYFQGAHYTRDPQNNRRTCDSSELQDDDVKYISSQVLIEDVWSVWNASYGG